MVSLVSFLDENARRQPDHLACVVGDDSLSYAELRDASCRFAGALASLGLQPGDRVSLYMPNSAAYVACYLGVMRAGMIANPVNGVLTPHEVGYMLTDSGAAVLVSTRGLADGLAGVLAPTPVQHVISVDTLDELPASPFGSLSYPDDLRLQLGGGAFLCNVSGGVEVDELPRTSVDYRIMGWAEAYFEHHDTFNHYGPPGGRDYYENTDRWRSTNKYFFADKFFVGGIQVDKHGNTNLIGTGEKGSFTFRGPGSVGINDVTTVRDAFVFMTAHDKQRFVEQADYVSMPGPRTYREKDLMGNGPQFIVSPRCVFDFSGPGQTAALVGLFPGHTEEEVAEHTGWEIVRSPHFVDLQPPSDDELCILRTAIDRKGVLQK